MNNPKNAPVCRRPGTRGKKVHPGGVVKNLWGLDIGLWESKDEKNDIEAGNTIYNQFQDHLQEYLQSGNL
jgi:hypothetical protein